jgi:hypothetical protein
MDEFAQFLNASIHPPNELSVPRCYPDPAPYQRSLLAAPMTAPNSRRSSASSRGAFMGNSNRSLSLGYQQVGFFNLSQSVSLSRYTIFLLIRKTNWYVKNVLHNIIALLIHEDFFSKS